MSRVRGRVRHVEPASGMCRSDAADVLGAEIDAGPLDVRRTRLYSPDELYDQPRYAECLDARAYAWARQPRTPAAALAGALHDHAIDQALEEWILGRRIVGVMGGHDLDRDDPGYLEAARLGWLLGRSHVIATGGGPGAMEAANLGGRLARYPHEEVALAVAMLGVAPSFRPSIDAWIAPARAVRERWPDGAAGLGVPTWHYGHEPPHLFASAVAKYLRNAIREAILLELCTAGIVFLPGAGGTVQEVFQDACENYYATGTAVAPMVLVGRAYWTTTLPVWPLLEALARGRQMADSIHLVDSVEEAAELISRPPAATAPAPRSPDGSDRPAAG